MNMNAREVIEAIHGSYATGSKHGFRNTLAMLDALCPERTVPVIHVAGTNGKGSTCAMLESILRRAGYRTGLYTSPFLQAYPERIRLDGVPLTDALIEKYGNPLVKAAEGLDATPFEIGTALALSVFEGEQVDFAIVEVGMGGRLDPTNVVQPILCGIAAIGLDHTAYLGDTLEAIAGEKAGIIKPNVAVVCHPAEDGVAAVFARVAKEKNAPLRQLSTDMIASGSSDAHGSTATFVLEETWRDMRLSLPGEHQLTNALTVLAMVEELRKQGRNIPESAVREGLANTRWPARLEWCGRVLIDGAHNIQGVSALAAFTGKHLPGRRVLLTGVLADKLQPEMLRQFKTVATDIVTVTPDSPRALPAVEYADALNRLGAHAIAADSLSDGLEKARKLAGDDGVIVAAGSLYFAGELRTLLGLGWK